MSNIQDDIESNTSMLGINERRFPPIRFGRTEPKSRLTQVDNQAKKNSLLKAIAMQNFKHSFEAINQTSDPTDHLLTFTDLMKSLRSLHGSLSSKTMGGGGGVGLHESLQFDPIRKLWFPMQENFFIRREECERLPSPLTLRKIMLFGTF